MNETMMTVFDMWHRYWNESGYFWLLLLAILFLLFVKKDRKTGSGLVVYQLLIFLVYFCPVTAWVIQKCIGWLVYWRVLWLFPVVPVLAYVFVQLLERMRRPVIKIIGTVLLAAVVMTAGTSVWQAGNYVKVSNRQQIPDEVVKIASIIEENRSSEDSLCAVDDHVASYIRVYDPSIKMPYGREGRGAISHNARRLYYTIIIPDPPVKKITIRAKRENCEFVVFQVQNEKSVKLMERYGYKLLEKAGAYGVFQRIKK